MSSTPPNPERVDRGRRRFWRDLAGQLFVAGEEIRGRAHVETSRLDTLPPEKLARVVPVLAQDEDLDVREDGLWRCDGEGNEKRILAGSEQQACILRRFSGEFTLAQVGKSLSEDWDLPEAQAVELTTDLFLKLARAGLAHPAAPPDDHGETPGA